MKSLIFKCNGETFIIRYPYGNSKGADAAVQSWVDNPRIDFTESHREALFALIRKAHNLFGP